MLMETGRMGNKWKRVASLRVLHAGDLLDFQTCPGEEGDAEDQQQARITRRCVCNGIYKTISRSIISKAVEVLDTQD